MARRRLSTNEMAEARLVFGDGLNYRRVYIVENTEFPNRVAALGGSPRPNAVTLGNTSYFPETLRTGAEDIAIGDLRAMAWLIHELTHQWQFQRMGWLYLARTVWVQVTKGQAGYRYEIEAGRALADYNLEQQGDIARDYYCALKTGFNCTRSQQRSAEDWLPLVGSFRLAAV
jgi:type VI secretion system secreted protein VgrG